MNADKENRRLSLNRRKSGVPKTTALLYPSDSNLKQLQIFEGELATYSGDDPLSVWCKCIQWVEQNLIKKERKKHLEHLMQQCLSTLRERTQYFDDERFIEIWLKFACTIENPLEIYNYMYSRKIGCRSASFFIAWSWQLEQEENLDEAGKVLKEGIYLQAEPVKTLISHLSEFKIRATPTFPPRPEYDDTEKDNLHSMFSVSKPQNNTEQSPVIPVSKSELQADDEHHRMSMVFSQLLPLQDNYVQSNRLSSMRSCTALGNVDQLSTLQQKEVPTPSSSLKDNSTSTIDLRCKSPVVALFEPPDPMKLPMYDRNKVYAGAKELSLEEIHAEAWLKRKKAQENEEKVAEQEKLLAEQEEMIKKLQLEIELLKQERLSINPVFTPSSENSSAQKLPVESCYLNPITKIESSVIDAPLLKKEFLSAKSTTNYNEVSDIVNEMYSNIAVNPQNAQYLNTKENNKIPFNIVTSDQKLLFTDQPKEPQFKNDLVLDCPIKQHFCSVNNKDALPFSIFNESFEHVSSGKPYGNGPMMQQNLPNQQNVPVTDKNIDNVPSKGCFQGNNIYECASLNPAEINDKPGNKNLFKSNADPTFQDETQPYSEQFIHAPFLASTPCTQARSAKSISRVSITQDQNYYLSKSTYSNNTCNIGQLSVILETSKECYKSSSSSGSSASATRFSQLYSQEKSSISKHLDRTDITFKDPKPSNQYPDISNNAFEQDAESKDLLEKEIFEAYSTGINAQSNISNIKETNQFDQKKDFTDNLLKERVEIPKIISANSEEMNVFEQFTPLNLNTGISSDVIKKGNTRRHSTLLLPKSNIPKFNKTHAVLKESNLLNQNTDLSNNIVQNLKVESKNLDENEIHVTDFNPFDDKNSEELLESLNLPPEYYGEIKTSQTHIKNLTLGSPIEIANNNYIIEKLIAEGSYGKVFAAVEKDSNFKTALKVCKHASNWELYICTTLHKRLKMSRMPPNVHTSIMKINFAHRYSKTLILATEFSHRGTLVDLVNFYQKQNGVPELITLYLTLEMLQIMLKIHECKIVHADMKPDNVLLRDNISVSDVLDAVLQKTVLLKFIDFGRSIDLKLFKNRVCFNSVLKKDGCIEMKENKLWVFQFDWFGLLNCIHILLFSVYMKVKQNPDGRWGIEKKFKRYWDQTIWVPLFDELLNIPSCYQEPNIEKHTNHIKSKLKQNERDFKIQLTKFLNSYTLKGM